MRARRSFLLLAVFCVAVLRSAANGAAPTPDWRWELAGAAEGRTFRESADGVTVEARASFAPEPQELRMHGVYRTTQVVDERAQLSYRIHTSDGRLLQPEGRRFAWRAAPGGGREAEFDIVQSVADERGLRPAVVVNFDYVVEGEYWESRRHPGTFLPGVEVRPPARPAFFTVGAALLPPVLPAGARCRLPVWVRAEFGGEAPPYLAALDLRAVDGDRRLAAARCPLPAPAGGGGVVWYDFRQAEPGAVLLRPGFVWEGVRWFDEYEGNAFRRIRVVGPATYLAGAAFLALALGAAAGGLRRLRSRIWRRAGWVLVGAAATGLLAALAVSLHALLVLGLVAIWWLQRRVVESGLRAYWTVWGFLLLLDLYWRHIEGPADGGWGGTIFSAALAGLLLLPLAWVRGRRVAAGVATGLVLLAALVATGLAVYAGFFGDYPGLSDLMYAEQLDQVRDSIRALLVQRHFASWLLALAVCPGLWLSGAGRTAPPAG
jgi:hypothetical protein